MLIDSQDLPHGRRLECDVCIVGGGAAGITLARALKSERRSIYLLESGGLELEADTQALYGGHAEGPGLFGSYLRSSRLRFLGGTTNHWTGFCRPLDAMDFERRPWVPHSGWPIDRNELAPYYERAADVARIKAFDNWGETAHTQDGLMPPSDALVGKRFHYSRIRFGRAYGDELRDAKSINVIVHANVVNLEVDEGGSMVSRVDVATFTGKRFTIAARFVVLATGAVENARLLLISDAKHKTGLGNRSDRVGRFFMEHPGISGGLVCLTHPKAVLRLDELGGFLGLSEQTQRAHELLNVCIELNSRRDSVVESEAGGTPLELRDLFYRTAAIDRPGIQANSGHDYRYRRCIFYSEAAPYPESRVTLDRETDALGLRRVRLFWKTTALESRSIQQAKKILALELGKRQIGRMLLDTNDEAGTVPLGEKPWVGVRPGNHHMGTTRMSASASDGVVDRNCQVHDVSNLFVAGSSVFPTIGFANPTFTIVALALRLAQHLEGRLEH